MLLQAALMQKYAWKYRRQAAVLPPGNQALGREKGERSPDGCSK